MNMHKKIWKNAAACLLAALMFPGCLDDEGGGGESNEDKYRTIVISLNSMENSEMGTRADAIPDGEQDSFDEHYISSYWLLVLKQTDTEGQFVMDKIIDSNHPEYRDPTNGDENSNTELNVEVEIGQTYRFYALANLDGLQNGQAIIDELKTFIGKSFDPITLEATVKEMAKYPHDTEANTFIPMSSYGYDQYIQPTTTQLETEDNKGIALIRLIGKASATIENLTNETITLNALSMQQMRTGDIFLFPYDVNDYGTDDEPIRCLFQSSMIENYKPSFPASATGSPYSADFTILDEQKSIAANEKVEIAPIYLPETSWDDNADLTITADVSGRNPHPQTLHTSFLRRNDWLKIPIQITPVDATFEVNQQHMPIGGIPDKITFQPYEPTIPIISRTTDHAGKITVTFRATVGNNVLTDPVLLTNADEAAEGIERTGITVNLNEYDVLLEERNNLTTNNTAISGTLELTLQELSKPATAEVELLLVMVQKADRDDTDGIGPDDKRLAIPYTIKLTYNPE